MTTESPIDETTAETTNRRVSENVRELLFVLGTIAGVTVFPLGLAFFILGVSIDTQPPAPYVPSLTQKYLLMGGSAVTMVVGGGVVRASARFAGW